MLVKDILHNVYSGKRVSFAEGIYLLENAELLELGEAARYIADKKHPENIITFVIDRNINYTNICKTKCRFCAFHRGPNHPDAYVISTEELNEKIEETIAHGGTQLLIQGGLNEDLSLEYYLSLLQGIKENYDIHIHSFSPPEIIHIADKEGLTIRNVLEQLREAGLDSIPGGGAEILTDRVRNYISPLKVSTAQWLEVMRQAHLIGMRTTATMMFGSVETLEERIIHLDHLRSLQDENRGFTAFIPWSFQPVNTEIGGETATGVEYLRMLAVARIYLDNFDNIQASWVTQGAKMAQVALWFGANDFGSTMLEENVVRAAGVINKVPLSEILHCITAAGKQPAQRDTYYNILKRY